MNIQNACKLGGIRQFKAYDIIFSEGDVGTVMYIVLKGEVEITADSPRGAVQLALLGPGGFLGEMSLLENLPRTGTAIALEETMTLVIKREHFMAFIRSEPQVAYKIMRSLSSRVRKQNELLFEKKATCLTRKDLVSANRVLEEYFKA